MDTEEKSDKNADQTNEEFLNEIILKSPQYSPSKISKVSTSRNIKKDNSIPYETNLYNNFIYQQNPIPRQQIQYDTLGLYTYWREYESDNKDFFKDIQIEEHDINLNSFDRDISVNSNTLNFTVWLSPGSTRSKSFLPRVFKNVKYISFEHVIFPKYIQLNKFRLTQL
jgi:hypothetical protein